jgi:hypothetical protein
MDDVLRVRIEPIFSPMPESISRALFGSAATTATEPPEPSFPNGSEPFGFFAVPTIVKADEDEEEREYRHPLDRKLIAPDVAASTPAPFSLPDIPHVSPADFDPEEISANPIRRFIYDRAARMAGASPSLKTEKLDKNADEDIPRAKDFAQIRDDIFEAYELKMAKLAKNADDEADFSVELQDLITQIISDLDNQYDDEDDEAYDKRIALELNTELVRQGHRPVLNY